MKRLIVLVIVLIASLVVWLTTVSASDSAARPSYQGTEVPTERPFSEVTPQDLPSLSGVGGTPIQANVRIRSAPSIEARQIGILRFERFIDIVGTNGFDTERECNNFEDDLDMWVQVMFGDRQRGWIARCTLYIYGDMSRLPIEATPEAVG